LDITGGWTGRRVRRQEDRKGQTKRIPKVNIRRRTRCPIAERYPGASLIGGMKNLRKQKKNKKKKGERMRREEGPPIKASDREGRGD